MASTEKLALEQATDFIESLTRDPLLLPDDIEMTLDDVQAHARIELASIRKVLGATPQEPMEQSAEEILAVSDAQDDASFGCLYPAPVTHVVPLIWSDLTEDIEDNWTDKATEAVTIVGVYRVEWFQPASEWWVFCQSSRLAMMPSLDEAKAAANTDYRQKIISALNAPPPQTRAGGCSPCGQAVDGEP